MWKVVIWKLLHHSFPRAAGTCVFLAVPPKQPGRHRRVQDDVWLGWGWGWGSQQGASLLFLREMQPRHVGLLWLLSPTLPGPHFRDLKQPPLKGAPSAWFLLFSVFCFLLPDSRGQTSKGFYHTQSSNHNRAGCGGTRL